MDQEYRERFIVLEREVKEMRHYLYGANNDGKLASIDKKLEGIRKDIVKLHLTIAGSCTTLGTVIGFLIMALVQAMGG